MGTNVPAPTFGPTGFVAPTEAAILAGIQADINAAFGGGVNPALSTPQGQLASSIAAVVGSVNDAFLFLSQMLDPALAQGRYQDAIGRIYFLERNPALPTVVEALCAGLAGVIIPVGAQAQANDGNIYACTQAGTIPSTGSVTLPFACGTTGPVACQPGALNTIYQAIPGWDSVTNLSAGVLGQNTESRYQFELRRQASVAANSAGSLPSILGAVLSVPGVLQAYATENTAASPVTIGGVTLAPNSVYVAVVGGAATAVARAIWSRKAPGCAYNGNTSQVIQDTSPGYSPPFPSYTVTWETPAALPVLFSVVLASNPQVPSNAASLIQAAIISAFAGGDGGSVATIGSQLLASRYYPPVAALGSWAQIRSLQIGSPNAPSASVLGYVSGATLTVTQTQSGALAVGQTLINGSAGGTIGGSGAEVAPGTTISSLGSGAGGTGTYNLSSTQPSIGGTFTGVNGTGAGTVAASNVSGIINLGDTLLGGTGMPPGTVVTGQLSGTLGGAGTYTVTTSTSLSAGGVACSANQPLLGVLANQNAVQVNINQTPTVVASEIAVTAT